MDPVNPQFDDNEAMKEYDAQADADKVRYMLDQYRAGGLAVVGAQDTLEALSMGMVEELIVTARQQHIEGDKDDVAILSTEVCGYEATLVGLHGSLTADEMEIPILVS